MLPLQWLTLALFTLIKPTLENVVWLQAIFEGQTDVVVLHVFWPSWLVCWINKTVFYFYTVMQFAWMHQHDTAYWDSAWKANSMLSFFCSESTCGPPTSTVTWHLEIVLNQGVALIMQPVSVRRAHVHYRRRHVFAPLSFCSLVKLRF